MTLRPNNWLIVGGWLSAAAALLHVVCIFGGGDYYRFFGAGEEMARADEAGHWMPAIMTSFIALILAIWSAYAFSGAGLIRRLPLVRTALVIISAIYILRGLLLIPIMIEPAMRTAFNIWSSIIVLGFGIIYAWGTRLSWTQLSVPGEKLRKQSI